MRYSKISPLIEKIAPEIEAYIRDLLDNEVLEEVEDLVMPPQEEA